MNFESRILCEIYEKLKFCKENDSIVIEFKVF